MEEFCPLSSLQNEGNAATFQGSGERTAFLRSQHLNSIQVRRLTRPLRNLHLFFLKPFRGGPAGALWRNLSPLQLEVTNRWQDGILWEFLVTVSWGSKTAPDHHATRFHCCYDGTLRKRCDTFNVRCGGANTFHKVQPLSRYHPDVCWQNRFGTHALWFWPCLLLMVEPINHSINQLVLHTYTDIHKVQHEFAKKDSDENDNLSNFIILHLAFMCS